MPPKKRGGRSIVSVKAKLTPRVRKNQNITPNSLPVLSFDVLTESVLGSNSTTTRKVTTTANNEMHIKLSNRAIESEISEGVTLSESEHKTMRITRNNCLKAQPKKESGADKEIKTDSMLKVQAVKLISRQQNGKGPVTRKRKLVNNNSPESNGSCSTTKRPCKNKRALSKNNLKKAKLVNSKNKKKVINKKKSPAVEHTVSEEPPATSPRKVTEVRNKETFNFEVTISGAPPPEGPEPDDAGVSCAPSECLSWTRDISSSSTVTCLTVHTDDIVRIDNKLPLLRLTDVARAPPRAPHHARSASPSSASSTTSSASSLSRLGGAPEDDDGIDRALQKLTAEFKRKDVEIINLVACENRKESPAVRNFRNRVCKGLTEESELIAHCDALKKLLIRDYQDLFSNIETCKKGEIDPPPPGIEFVKPRDVRNMIRCDSVTKPALNKDRVERGSPTRTPAPAAPAPGDERGNDDDDALSLFAESITGLDSSRKHDSVPPQDETLRVRDIFDGVLREDPGEYVPRPIHGNNKSESVTYRPSHITKRNEDGPRNQTVKIVCEKQNADSTSMYRETPNYYDDTSTVGVEDQSPFAWLRRGTPRATGATALPAASPAPLTPPAAACKPGPNGTGQPAFIADIYDVPKKFKSIVFLGVCFYNLASKCKREHCQFVHAELKVSSVSVRLRRLDCDTLFVQEYMMMRNWAALRRRYGLAFVLEGARRGLARVLLEMAIDFTKRATPNHAEDKALTVKVLEAIMLYMNTVDVGEFGNFLAFPASEGRSLFDVFMNALASTQNFSRFKSIFVNLSELMEHIPRPVEFEVASALLERVCILPHDARSAAAMLRVLRLSSPRVLQNTMIGLFERRLAADERLARDFDTLKRVAAEGWTCGGMGVAPPRSFSPDTTAPGGPAGGLAGVPAGGLAGGPASSSDCASAAPTNAIDFQSVESFRKLGEGLGPRRATLCPRRAGWFCPPSPGSPLVRVPRPVFRFPRGRPN